MRGGSAAGERRGGRNKGTFSKATDEIRELASPYVLEMVERHIHLALHAKDIGVKLRALKLLLEYVLGRVAPENNDESRYRFTMTAKGQQTETFKANA